MEWYVSRNGSKEGPFSPAQIRTLAESDALLPTDMVWHTGMENWKPISEIPGLLTPPPLEKEHLVPRSIKPDTNAATTTSHISNTSVTSQEKSRAGIGKASIWVFAFLVAFFGVKAAKQYWWDSRAIESGLASASKELDQMREQAVKGNPGVPVSEAFRQEAVKQSTAKLASQSGDKKQDTAADMYFGFLFVNTKARPEFCREYGVEIPAWTHAFEQLHTKETAQARAIYAKASVDENSLVPLLLEQWRKVISDDMTGIANTNNISIKEACQLFAERGSEFAMKMHISTVQPAVYKALMGLH